MLAGGDFHRRNLLGNRAMGQKIVGVGRLLDPIQIEVLRPAAKFQGLGQTPLLVGVDHAAHVGSGLFAQNFDASQIAVQVLRADLQFHRGEAGIAETCGNCCAACRHRSRTNRRTCRSRGSRARSRQHARRDSAIAHEAAPRLIPASARLRGNSGPACERFPRATSRAAAATRGRRAPWPTGPNRRW